MSSPTNALSKSPIAAARATSSEHDDDEVSKSLDSVHGKRTASQQKQQSNGSTPTSASRPASRNAAGNHRSEQFHAMLQSDAVDLDKLRKLSWGGIPVHHRPTAWRLLLVR